MKTQTMSDLTIWLDGKQAEEVNKNAKQYLLLNKSVKDMTAERDAVASELKLLNDGQTNSNTFETADFIIPIIYNSGKKSINTEVLERLYPEVFADERIWQNGKPYMQMGKIQGKV